jgi:hypothetical protein
MENTMSTTPNHNDSSITATAAGNDPQTVPLLTPEELVARLREFRKAIPDISPLTRDQRRAMRNRLYVSHGILQAQIDVLGASDTVESAVGQQPEEMRLLVDGAARWDTLENELKALLAGVAGANLRRREKLNFVGRQAYRVGASLTKDPAHAEQVPHIEEVRRLMRLGRRKKASPPDAPPTVPHLSTTSEPAGM